MKEIFKAKALENIKVAEIAFENNCFNASANRAYYAAFHAAIALLYSIGLEPKIDHRTIQSLFAEQFVNRRKVFSSKHKGVLENLQEKRNDADYKFGVSKKVAKNHLATAKEFINDVLGEIK